MLKNNINFYLKEGETYGDIVNEILKNDNIDCYTKYVNEFCFNRLLTKKKKAILCFHPLVMNGL